MDWSSKCMVLLSKRALLRFIGKVAALPPPSREPSRDLAPTSNRSRLPSASTADCYVFERRAAYLVRRSSMLLLRLTSLECRYRCFSESMLGARCWCLYRCIYPTMPSSLNISASLLASISLSFFDLDRLLETDDFCDFS